MLLILTGDVQTGKTRWLERLIAELEARGIGTQGVIAPGVWRSGDDPQANAEFVDSNGFEKLGIDNVLLPQNERIAFARRRDIALAEGLLDPNAQSEKANLMWHIDDAAIARVNEHLASLPHPVSKTPGARVAQDAQEARVAQDAKAAQAPSLLVIDELGRLELLRGEGLVEAMRLLDQGPSDAFPHALVIVREALLDNVSGRFPAWGAPQVIHPDAPSLKLVLSAFA